MAVLRELGFTLAGQAALTGTKKAVLRLGRNYVGTEHMLLGVPFAGGDDAGTLAGLGLSAEVVEEALGRILSRILDDRRAGS